MHLAKAGDNDMTADVAVCHAGDAQRNEHEHVSSVKMVQYVHAVPCSMCSAAAKPDMPTPLAPTQVCIALLIVLSIHCHVMVMLHAV